MTIICIGFLKEHNLNPIFYSLFNRDGPRRRDVKRHTQVHNHIEKLQGDLFDLLQGGRPLSEPDVECITSCVSNGLAALHALGIAHRDTKSENISRELLKPNLDQLRSVTSTCPRKARSRSAG